MIVLGIDPGTTKHGVAILDAQANGRADLIAYGHLTKPEVETQIRENHALVAIEVPESLHGGMAPAKALSVARSLLAVRGEAEQFAGFAAALGRSVVKISPRAWRKALCGSFFVDNAMVERALRLRLTVLPRTNDHARDAAGVAWVAAMEAMNAHRGSQTVDGNFSRVNRL